MEYIFFGLGNKSKYSNTRHNIGKDFVSSLVENSNGEWKSVGKYRVSSILLGPHIFTCVVGNVNMNMTGKILKDFFNEVEPEKLIVVYDDIDLSVGQIKFSRGGSSGGHKGVQSIIDIVGEDFLRLRIGVGKGNDVPEYVLGEFPKEEKEIIAKKLNKELPNIIQSLCNEGFAAAQQSYKTK